VLGGDPYVQQHGAPKHFGWIEIPTGHALPAVFDLTDRMRRRHVLMLAHSPAVLLCHSIG